MAVEQLKQSRSKAKTVVTTSAKRLIGAAQRGSDFTILRVLMTELEKAYGDFCIITDEYEDLVNEEGMEAHKTVNGEDLDTYKANVLQTYEAAKTQFHLAKKTDQEVADNKAAGPIRDALRRDINRLKTLITQIDTALTMSCPDLHAMQYDHDQLEPNLRVVLDQMDKLNSLQTPMQVQVEACEVDDLIKVTDQRKREVNLRLLNQGSIPAASVPVTTCVPVASPGPAAPGGITSTSLIATCTSNLVPATSSPAPHTLTAGPRSNTLLSTSNVAPVVSPAPAPSYSAGLTSSVSLPMGSQFTATTVPVTPVVTSAHYGTAFSPPYPHMMNMAAYTSPSTPTVMNPSMGTMPSYYGAAAPMYPVYPGPGWSPAYYPALPDSRRGTGSSSGHSNSDIKLEKIALPTFTGLRKDWPEFKSVWKELAENAYSNKKALAHQLKQSVKGEASQRIKSVYITRPEAYGIMWEKLEAHYDDTSASVQAALDSLQNIKSVKEEDFRGLVELVDAVEATFSQLSELNELNTLTMRDVDQINGLLPTHLKLEWIRKYHGLAQEEKLKPFVPFMKFLEREREAVARLAETQPKKKRDNSGRTQVQSNHGDSRGSRYKRGQPSSKKQFYACAFRTHRKDGIKHITEECKEFLKLPIKGQDGRYEVLKEVNACFICFGDHRRDKCPSSQQPCSSCNKSGHHHLLCLKDKGDDKGTDDHGITYHTQITAESHATKGTSLALYPIQQAVVSGTGKRATIFCDGGSNTTYITHRAADRLNARKLKRFTLDVTTMGNVQKTYDTRQYEIPLTTQSGRKVQVIAYGMERITGPISRLNTNVLTRLFPEYEPEALQRQNTSVDILLGCDYFGLHPKQEIAKTGDHLSVMKGEFGICLQGSHPELKEETCFDANLAKTVHKTRVKSESFQTCVLSHPEFSNHLPLCGIKGINAAEVVVQNSTSHTVQLVTSKKMEGQLENFIQGEELATETSPRCGSCKCGKCPTVGHTYSFREEQELKMIQNNLQYDEANKCWITSYPWLVDPSTLPDNYAVALATLKNTERKLKNDTQWADTYKAQIQDMVDRGVARKLTNEELKGWKGPKFHISHLAVLNPRSPSTPVRIVFNSSQIYKGVSLNACLAKGPDCYLNNLIGILLRWREEHTALVGDIKKMFNSVYLKPLEQHCHRFLWRELDENRAPDVYVMERVNMGDTPAPAISSEAVYQTANKFQQDNPRAAELLKKSSYVDDLIDSVESKAEAILLARDVEEMLSKGGFKIKCWQFSGESGAHIDLKEDIRQDGNRELVRVMLKGTDENLRVLGLGWKPQEDVIVFQVTLNFSRKRRGVRTGLNLVVEDLPSAIPTLLTRRIVLEQVMRIYDPLGLVCAFTLLAKIYLRETWSLKLGWDDPLPSDLYGKWTCFFTTMFQLELLKLERCLHPPDAVGQPWLIILSDGSDLAYGFAAYVRWQLEDSSYWCRLIMAKCRIAPMNKLSTPQMELNAAVLSKRGRKVIEKEMRFEFKKVLQLVDSETVLNMINKTSTRFKVYEGVRIGEIQAATNGNMSCWAWMSGQYNTADWLTRGRTPQDLDENSEWWNGPSILYKPVEEWGLKFGLQKEESLPGEKKICATSTTKASPPLIDYHRCSNIDKVIWIVARLRNIAKHKSFRGGRSTLVTAEHLRKAEEFIVKDIQGSIDSELQKRDHKGRSGGQYSGLNPVKYQHGMWIVGERMLKYNAMTADSELQKLLPTCHPGTRLFMKRAHQAGHRGRDATLARFRQKYWVPHGAKLAKSVKNNCQLCKLREPKSLKQEMGLLPEARLKPSPAFSKVMLDLFGPYPVRGEVQKRTTGKAYGVIFTDMVMRAVHIEAVFGYDTSSFLMALSRFASIRGWPDTLYSDPGSQLIGAERELKETWEKMDQTMLNRSGAEKGLTWIFGPADSPWYQGAVESLVKSAKRAIHFAIQNQRLSASEFITVCAEVANLLNERPIGVQPSSDSDINVFTPNSLLLGRAMAKNPGGWQPYCSNLTTRYHLVQVITDKFWQKWTELYAPTLVIRRKWTTSHRNLCPGDVVMVADRNPLRGEYHLGLIKQVHTSSDGKVRQVSLSYKNYKVGEKLQVYSGAKDVVVKRSAQRLALLVPVDYNARQADQELVKEIREVDSYHVYGIGV